MTTEQDQLRREAIQWLMLIREEHDDASLMAEFEAWRLADPAHGLAWDSVAKTFDVIGETPPAFTGHWRKEDWQRDTLDFVHRRTRRERRGLRPLARRKSVWLGGAIAASLALVAAPSINLRLRADHMTSAGELKTVPLADGSTARLGPDSSIRVSFNAQGRTIKLLSGQAWFEVRHDPRRPFVVDARNVTTTVLGTGFDVRIIGAATLVSVGHGRVRVQDHDSPDSMRILTAGQWVEIKGDHSASQGREQPELTGGWRKKEVAALNRSIADVVDEIRPWYWGKVILADKAVAGRHVTGVYRMDDPQAALEALVTPHGGKVTRITPWLTIVSAS